MEARRVGKERYGDLVFRESSRHEHYGPEKQA